MRSLVLFLTFIGVVFITIGYVKTNMRCPPPVIKYQYIPRTFEEEQNNPVPLMSVYGTMFDKNSPWMNPLGAASINK